MFLAILATGCFSPSVDPCRVTCANDGECPGGAVCGEGGQCHPAGQPTACSAGGDGGVDPPDGGAPAGSFSALAVGQEFACAIGRADGEVYCWGNNFLGQLGDGTRISRGAAGVVAEPGPWKAIGAGTYHACAIKQTGEAYCWGAGDRGQVDGGNDVQVFDQPAEVPVPRGVTFTAIDGGGLHTCAVATDGQMWCWGLGDGGALGRAGAAGTNAPAPVDGDTRFETVSAGDTRTCGIATDDTAWCWGSGALGVAATPSSEVPLEVAGDHAWRHLSVGLSHSCGVTIGGELRCWGVDQIGELGEAGTSEEPAIAQPGADFTIALAGRIATCAQRTGETLCFGDNRQGQLGRGNRDYLPQPATVELERPVVAGETGYEFTCLLDDVGVVWCMGHDDTGQCGDGVIDDAWIGAPVQNVTGTISILSSTDDHTCALNEEGRLWCWGSNAFGELGVGDHVDRGTPVELLAPNGMPWSAVSAGDMHTCAIADTRLYCWGADGSGQVGNGGPDGDVVTPLPIATTTSWQGVSAGVLHTCATDTDSERWCWGAALNGALGGGTTVTTNQNAPVRMPTTPGPTSWLRLAAGDQFTCGISGGSAPGELWCWGDNSNGELGVPGAAAFSHEPLLVDEPTADWYRVAVDSLNGAACALRGSTSGGELHCWGLNEQGQLGLGGTMDRDAPERVGTDAWLQVDLGSGFTCGIDAELHLRCWGLNESRVLFDDPEVSVASTPPDSPTVEGEYRLVAAGWRHVCAVRDDQQIFCWGDGTYGQHGNGNQAKLVPTPVVLAE